MAYRRVKQIFVIVLISILAAGVILSVLLPLLR